MARGQDTVDTTNGIFRATDLPFWGGLTMMGWVRIATIPVSGQVAIFGFTTVSSGGNSGLVINTTPDIFFYHDDGAGAAVVIAANPQPTTVAYHHYAFTISSPNSTLGSPYVNTYFEGNSVMQAATVGGKGGDTIDNICAIGGLGSFSARCFVQHLRCWDRALTAAEVKREMRSRFAVTRRSLIADFPLLSDDTDLVQESGWTSTGMLTEGGPVLGGWPDPMILPLAAGAATATPIMIPGYYV